MNTRRPSECAHPNLPGPPPNLPPLAQARVPPASRGLHPTDREGFTPQVALKLCGPACGQRRPQVHPPPMQPRPAPHPAGGPSTPRSHTQHPGASLCRWAGSTSWGPRASLGLGSHARRRRTGPPPTRPAPPMQVGVPPSPGSSPPPPRPRPSGRKDTSLSADLTPQSGPAFQLCLYVYLYNLLVKICPIKQGKLFEKGAMCTFLIYCVPLISTVLGGCSLGK